MIAQPQLEILFNVFIAMLLAGIIGVERELESKPAGLRTHMLVGGAAALLVGLVNPTIALLTSNTSGIVRTDPIRIIEQWIDSRYQNDQ